MAQAGTQSPENLVSKFEDGARFGGGEYEENASVCQMPQIKESPASRRVLEVNL